MKKIALIAILVPLLVLAAEKVGYLGVSGEDLSEAMKVTLELEYGILVERVNENSPAAKGDIKVGDVILEIDGNKITDFNVLRNIVQQRPSKNVEIRVYRSNKITTKKVELGEREKKVLFDMDFPSMLELKDLLGKGTKELQEQIDNIKEMVEQLKEEIEELKKKIK